MVNQKIALVIDDEREVVDVVRDVLKEELGYLVLAATDPEVAVDLAQSYLFDLLILDLHMPKLDGFQVLELVRKKQPGVKVMVITGLYEQYRERLKHVRVDKIIEKPFEMPRFAKDILALAGEGRTGGAEPEGRPVPKARILLVDDETEQSQYLKEFLSWDQPNQYEVELSETAEEALVKINEFEPDLVLFDIKMPHMRGDEMVEKVLSGPGHKPRLFICVSAIAFTDTVERIKALGCSYVTKPFRVEDVLELVRAKCGELGLSARVSEAEGA